MKNLKFGILAFAIVGVAGVFLPFLKLGETSMSLWDVREMDAGQVYLTLGSFAIPLLLGLLAVIKAPMARWQAIVATLCFAVALIKMRGAFDFALGAKLMMIAAIAGLVVALLSSIKPESKLVA